MQEVTRAFGRKPFKNMRCKKCGWPNKPNETSCVKCGTPLTSEDDSEMSFDGASNGGAGGGLNETIREDDVFGPVVQNQESNKKNIVETEEKNKPCPKCGYPLRPGTEKCPNCKFQVSGSSQSSYSSDAEPKKKNNAARRPTRIELGSGDLRSGTVNPYMMNLDLEPSFILKPIKKANERRELEELEFEGKSVLLNRDNTESGNQSITSREQAIITNADGHWYIEDKSEQKTTFVQAANRIRLSDGDLILLGNRLFEFHE